MIGVYTDYLHHANKGRNVWRVLLEFYVDNPSCLFFAMGFNNVSKNSLYRCVGEDGPAMIGLLFKVEDGIISINSAFDCVTFSIVSLIF